MELSKRLRALADMVSPGYRLADIGTDHAYIPIWLAGQGRIREAVAVDVNPGPLERAKQHIREAGLEEQISTRISDGFSALAPGEADSAVIAGMGGPLMIRILREGAGTVQSLKECILQPQSEIEKVRAFLLEEGFSFIREDMVEEDGKYYPMMSVRPPSAAAAGEPAAQSGPGWTDAELRYGKLLLEGRHPVLREYLEKELRIKKDIIRNLEKNGSDRACRRAAELKKECKCAEKGLIFYALQ